MRTISFYSKAYLPAHVDSLIQYSAMAAELGRNYDAFTTAAEAVDLATEPATPQIVSDDVAAKALTNLAAIRYGTGDAAAGADPIRRATRLIDNLATRRGKTDRAGDAQLLRAAAYNQRALIEATLGDTAAALASAEIAVATYKDISDTHGASHAGLPGALNNLANVYRQRSEYSARLSRQRRSASSSSDRLVRELARHPFRTHRCRCLPVAGAEALPARPPS